MKGGALLLAFALVTRRFRSYLQSNVNVTKGGDPMSSGISVCMKGLVKASVTTGQPSA